MSYDVTLTISGKKYGCLDVHFLLDSQGKLELCNRLEYLSGKLLSKVNIQHDPKDIQSRRVYFSHLLRIKFHSRVCGWWSSYFRVSKFPRGPICHHPITFASGFSLSQIMLDTARFGRLIGKKVALCVAETVGGAIQGYGFVGLITCAAENDTFFFLLSPFPSSSLLHSHYRLPVEGLVGMAFESLASGGTQSLPFVLANSGVIPKNIFAFRLSSARGKSSLDMGYLDRKRYIGEPWYYPISLDPDYGRYTYYQIGNSVHYVNGEPVEGTRGYYLIDSGSTLIIGSLDQAAAFWSAIPGAEVYAKNPHFHTFPCADPLSISLSFGGGDKQHNIDPEDFNLGRHSLIKKIYGVT